MYGKVVAVVPKRNPLHPRHQPAAACSMGPLCRPERDPGAATGAQEGLKCEPRGKVYRGFQVGLAPVMDHLQHEPTDGMSHGLLTGSSSSFVAF